MRMCHCPRQYAILSSHRGWPRVTYCSLPTQEPFVLLGAYHTGFQGISLSKVDPLKRSAVLTRSHGLLHQG